MNTRGRPADELLSRLSRNAFASVIQVVVSSTLLFALYRFLAQQLAIEEIGVWSLVIAGTAVARLGESGIGNGVTKFVAGDLGRDDRDQAASTIVMSALVVATIIGMLCLALEPGLSAGLPALISRPDLLTAGRGLLPWALSALWVGAISQIFLNALDACQRSDLKATAANMGAVAQLVTAYWIVPTYGIAGLGPIQLIQTVVSASIALIFVLWTLKVRPRAWFAFNRKRLFEVLRYGGGVQFAALGILLFDPTVKALLSLFGGLGLTGVYEIANRVVGQFGAVIVAGYQVLVPYLAHRAARQTMDLKQAVLAYRAAHGLLLGIALPGYALLAAALPSLFTLWLGRYDQNFVEVSIIVTIGWTVNTLVVSPYMIFLAMGKLRWIIWSHVAIGLLNVLFAGFGGWLVGGLGVVSGAMIALALGSLLLSLAFHRQFSVPVRDFAPPEIFPLFTISLVGSAGLLTLQCFTGRQLHQSFTLAALYICFALSCLAAFWRYPKTVETVAYLRGKSVTSKVLNPGV